MLSQFFNKIKKKKKERKAVVVVIVVNFYTTHVNQYTHTHTNCATKQQILRLY